MKPRLSTDLLAGLLFVALGAFAIIYGWQYPFGSSARMGPGYYPRLISIALIIIGGILVARSFFLDADRPEKIFVRPLYVVILGTVGFGLMIEHAGLVIASIALIVTARFADRDFRPLEVSALCVVLIAFAAGIFWYGLSLPFPLLPF
jgi:hypothetical protein